MNEKPQLFQLQKFYNKRKIWDDCFPEFVERYKQTEKQMEELKENSFSATAKPRQDLMVWFLNKIQSVDNIEKILEKIPAEEYIPISGKNYTKEEFLGAFYSVYERRISSKQADSESTQQEMPQQLAIKTSKSSKPVFKLIANFHAVGGGEMSSINLCKMFQEKGYEVHLHPTRSINNTLKNRLPNGVQIRESMLNGNPQGESDCVMLYANDFVYKLTQCKDKVQRLFDNSNRVTTCLNFVMGESWQEWYSSRVDKFLFLNTTKENELIKRFKDKNMPEKETLSLAPPVFLEPYLDINPDYSKINFVRTGRYGGKYDEKDYTYLINEWMNVVPDAHYWFMACPPFITKRYGKDARFHCSSWDSMTIDEILSKGSVFHYRLPNNMRDQGPRVLVEALASGIPCIVEPRDGAKDRVNTEVGWFAETNEQFVDVVKEIRDNPSILREKGERAKEYAKIEFNPYRWYNEISGNY